jgi:hypothetical protein
MFLLVTYALFLILPFASSNIAYRTATLFAVMIMVINIVSIFARLFLRLPEFLDPEALGYFSGLFLPVYLGSSLVIGATILPIAVADNKSYAKKLVIVVISTFAFLYLSYAAVPLIGDLLFGMRLRSPSYYFIPNLQRIFSSRWDYIHLTVNTALAASATIAIMQRWLKPL